MKRLDLVVGPNGAGKSTFVDLTLQPLVPFSSFVNADEIARIRWPDDPVAHSYDAARLAARTRSALITRGDSFIAETVFSHPSKLDLIVEARRAGYIVALHVLMIPEELSVHRVRLRVAAGGHHVPEDKIRARHRRLWGIVVEAAPLADHTTFYDNSASTGPRIVAQFSGRDIVGEAKWPQWAPSDVVEAWSGW